MLPLCPDLLEFLFLEAGEPGLDPLDRVEPVFGGHQLRRYLLDLGCRDALELALVAEMEEPPTTAVGSSSSVPSSLIGPLKRGTGKRGWFERARRRTGA